LTAFAVALDCNSGLQAIRKDGLDEVGDRTDSPTCHGRGAGKVNFWRVTIDEARTGCNDATGTRERHHRTKREECLAHN